MTKAVSGETLALVLDYLRQANAQEIDGPSCGRLISAALSAQDAFVDLQSTPRPAAPFREAARDQTIDAQSLARLNVMLPWASFNTLDEEGRVLGAQWSAGKRAGAQPIPDTTVERLNARLPLAGMSILEVGCFEGHHTASLARYSPDLWAFDARIENVVKTLVKLWVLGLERSVRLERVDIETGPVSEQLARRGRSEKFDLVHHRGVLYHLSRPVEHLMDISSLCEKHLYLHTQLAGSEQVNGKYASPLGEFEACLRREPSRSHSPFAGVAEHAIRLTRECLVTVLGKLGFPHVTLLREVQERHGPRIELIASRQ